MLYINEQGCSEYTCINFNEFNNYNYKNPYNKKLIKLQFGKIPK